MDNHKYYINTVDSPLETNGLEDSTHRMLNTKDFRTLHGETCKTL